MGHLFFCFTGFYLVLLGFTVLLWLLCVTVVTVVGFNLFLLGFMGFTGFYWVLPSFTVLILKNDDR